MRARHVAAATIAVALLAGCSGDDDSAATTTVTSPPTVPSVTTEATTSPTSGSSSTTDAVTTVATTEPETTTSSPETTTTPTDPPTTSSTPEDGVTDLVTVVEVVEKAWQSSLEALRDPTSDERRTRLGDYYTGTLLEGFENLVDNYREQNYRTIENLSEPDSLEVELASLAVNEQGTFATVQACDVTAGIVVETAGNPDGSDRVVDDRIGRVVIEFEVVKVGGTWKVENGREPEASERIASCG